MRHKAGASHLQGPLTAEDSNPAVLFKTEALFSSADLQQGKASRCKGKRTGAQEARVKLQENRGSPGQVSLENWGGQRVQSEENWLQDGGWLDQEQQQQEEGGEFYKESKWKEQQAEKRFYREPLTQQLGGQRNPRSSFF